MGRHSNINSANGPFLTQAEKIEDLLRSRFGQWIPAYELADIALQYCARINSIRKKLLRAGDHERIENKTEWVNGQCHGSYRIVSTVEGAPISSFSAGKPPKPQNTIPESPDWYEREHGPRPSSHPWKTAFSEKRLTDPDCFTLTPPEPRR